MPETGPCKPPGQGVLRKCTTPRRAGRDGSWFGRQVSGAPLATMKGFRRTDSLQSASPRRDRSSSSFHVLRGDGLEYPTGPVPASESEIPVGAVTRDPSAERGRSRGGRTRLVPVGLFVAALTVAVGCSGESGGQSGALQFDEPGSTTTTSTTIDLSSFGSDESVTPASVESTVPSSVVAATPSPTTTVRTSVARRPSPGIAARPAVAGTTVRPSGPTAGGAAASSSATAATPVPSTTTQSITTTEASTTTTTAPTTTTTAPTTTQSTTTTTQTTPPQPVVDCDALEAEKDDLEARKREIERQYRDDRETREQLLDDIEALKREVTAQLREHCD